MVNAERVRAMERLQSNIVQGKKDSFNSQHEETKENYCKYPKNDNNQKAKLINISQLKLFLQCHRQLKYL